MVVLFDVDLQWLVEIFGGLYYLCNICGVNEGNWWCNEMQVLMDVEIFFGECCICMIVGFNCGYNGFQQIYWSCMFVVMVVIWCYIEEGVKILWDLMVCYVNQFVFL